MADINSLFGGGGQTLNTNGGLPGMGGGGGGDADFFKAMAMRKMQQADQDRQRRQEREDQAFAMAKQAAQNANRPPELNAQDQHMKDMRDRDEIIQMQARQGKAPTRRITGSNIIAGDVLDPLAMNAYQRQLFLPKESSQQGNINAPSALTQDKESAPGSTMTDAMGKEIARQGQEKLGMGGGGGGGGIGGGGGGDELSDWHGLRLRKLLPEQYKEDDDEGGGGGGRSR